MQTNTLYVRQHLGLSPFPVLKPSCSRSKRQFISTPQHRLLMDSGCLVGESRPGADSAGSSVVIDYCLREGGGSGSMYAMYLPFLVRTVLFIFVSLCLAWCLALKSAP